VGQAFQPAGEKGDMNDRQIKRHHRAALALMGRAWELDQTGEKERAYVVAKRAFHQLAKGLRRLTAQDVQPMHFALFKLAANIARALQDEDLILELIDEWLAAHPPGKLADELKALARRIMSASLAGEPTKARS